MLSIGGILENLISFWGSADKEEVLHATIEPTNTFETSQLAKIRKSIIYRSKILATTEAKNLNLGDTTQIFDVMTCYKLCSVVSQSNVGLETYDILLHMQSSISFGRLA